jgi:serine protease AprX
MANPDYTGRGLTLAFLDSGFYPHPDLTQPVNRMRAYIDATLTEPVEKAHYKRAEVTSWHGLMTTSVAAGNGHQSNGVYRGLASEASLVLVKTGNRRGRRIPDSDILRALRWVVDHRAQYAIRVVNISLGGDIACTGAYTPLDSLVEEAVARGLVVVAAAGNGGVNQIIPPASAPSAITVGGLDDQNSLDPRFHRMWRSSYGQGVNQVLKPDVIAPAIWVAAPILPHTRAHNEAILLWRLHGATDRELNRFLKTNLAQAHFKQETLRRPLAEIRAVIQRRIMEQKYIHPDYQHVDGTSMAAPIVTSVVAQMLEANPALTPAAIKDILMHTAERLPYVPQAEQGQGVISAARAVAAALRHPGGVLRGLPVSPTVTPQTVTFVAHLPGAHEVSLVASFNHWQPAEHPLQEIRPSVWQIRVPTLPAGQYAYKFLVDGERWIHDVENPARIEDGGGGFHSQLLLK